jgi:predicted Zn-dependent protease
MQGTIAAQEEALLLDCMAEELAYSMEHLRTAEDLRPYFLSYTVTDTASTTLQARLGAIQVEQEERSRLLDVDLRVGSHELDNTRQLRGGGGFGGGGFFGAATQVCLDNRPEALRHTLWSATDQAFKQAIERYQRVLTNTKTMVEQEDPAHDFSREAPQEYSETGVTLGVDRPAWAQRLRRVSDLAREHPTIHSSSVSLVGTAENRYLVSSESSRLKTGRELWRVMMSVSTRAEDGMELNQVAIFDAANESGLPTEETMRSAMSEVIQQVLALREAPLVEPYTGPAILLNRASGVFFHEIFGHRIEGHRQKSADEGQTFTKMIEQAVLPAFLSIVDDPTLERHGEQDLRGFFRFDDEGIPAERVSLVEQGILKTFLLSRSPVAGFEHSNGHGRREPGREVVSRQGNLMVLSDQAVPFARLREMLIEQCKIQGKPFGLLFEDITGGFTTTTRGGPQAFKVQPVVVYKVFADGRDDQLVRGVDIVGTPLSCFSKILATGDDPAVFNGSCGAESGWVPVSAISPSILVEQIEIEKKERSQERLPLLASPIQRTPGQSDAAADLLLTALEDELQRCQELQVADLDAPYFVQFRATEREGHRMSASCGALLSSSPSQRRNLATAVRVGSYELDNSNFSAGGGGGFGGRRGGRTPGRGIGGSGSVLLPWEDSYSGIRQAAWLASDRTYKRAVETLTQKQAYMEGRDLSDRPDDFDQQQPTTTLADKGQLQLDCKVWEDRLRELSARFMEHKHLLDSAVDLNVDAGTNYLLNTEGTRRRDATGQVTLTLRAEVLADDGQRITDRIVHYAPSVRELPALEMLLTDADALAARLARTRKADLLDDYSGPVLFEGLAAPQLFEVLLAQGLGARPAPVGEGRRRRGGGQGLDKLLGRRILPDAMQIFDDPNQQKFGGKFLAGHYSVDDEGVGPERVQIVENGKLVNLVCSRTPTSRFDHSTGHGRGGRASIGCLFVESSETLSGDELRGKLREKAADFGLEYGILVQSLQTTAAGFDREALRRRLGRQRGGGFGGGDFGGLPDPLLISKIYVADGREQPLRACEFDELSINALRDILAVGKQGSVWNRASGRTAGGPTSIIAPAVLLETVDLYGIEEEYERGPVLPAPALRTYGSGLRK